eukprot:11662334-Alexandrium_andersonii.AAC.1
MAACQTSRVMSTTRLKKNAGSTFALGRSEQVSPDPVGPRVNCPGGPLPRAKTGAAAALPLLLPR